jgi:hypothetical protein
MKQIQNAYLLSCMEKLCIMSDFNTLLSTVLGSEDLSYTLTLYVALLFIFYEQQYNIVTCKTDHRDYTVQIIDTHRPVSLVYYSLH